MTPIDAQPRVPVTFNTGQILLGLSAGVSQWGADYRPAMRAAADWLVTAQDPDGCWRRHPSPFAGPGEKVYETHVAWGLIEAARVAASEPYSSAAERNLRWAMKHQAANGWFEKCCLNNPREPLTHTIGYTLRGFLEGYRSLQDRALLDAALRCGRGLLTALRSDGCLPGRLDRAWRPTVPWSCLTGSVQVAHCWLLLFQETGEHAFRDAALSANAFVRRTARLQGNPDIVGGIKGSFPVDGDYGRYEYLNWAAKFFVDANLLELDLTRSGRRG